jgi:hypothetical protein
MTLLVITPSRGRPDRMREMVEAVHATRKGDVRVVCMVDDDDPTIPQYQQILGMVVVVGKRRGLVGSTNEAAARFAQFQPFVASLGDDHRPVSEGWDVALCHAIADMGGTGIAYGDDQLVGEALPTAAVISSNIVTALGYMGPPALQHLYVDNFWRDLGNAAGCLAYLPDVVIRHDHPNAGRVEWDDTYREGNSTAIRDRDAYALYRETRFRDDVEKVRRCASVS